jgi:glutathione S-transferase
VGARLLSDLFARERLALGLASVAQLASFSPYALGPSFTAADCVAYMHFVMIKHTTLKVFGVDLTDQFLPELNVYMQLMNARPHVQAVMAARETAIADFLRLEVVYDG